MPPMRRETAPGFVAFGISLFLFGLAVQYATMAAVSCKNYANDKESESVCYGSSGSCIVYFLGTFATLSSGLSCISRSKVSMGVAGALLGIAAWAFGMATQSWVAASLVSTEGKPGPEAPFLQDYSVSAVSRTFIGFFWSFVAFVLVAAARRASTNEEPITRKEPWMIVGALGVYSLIQATTTWEQAAQPGLCGNFEIFGLNLGPNGGYCFGMILSGMGKFVSFALLVYVAGCALYAPTVADAPLITS